MKIDPYVDRHGQDIIGEDEYGVWWGTEDFPIDIEDYDENGRIRGRHKQVYCVSGYLLAQTFDAWVRASSMRRVRDYFLGMGIKELDVWKAC